MLSKLKILLLPLLATSAMAQRAGQGQAFEPILSFESSSSLPALLTLSAIDSETKKITDPKEAERLFGETQQSMKDIKDEPELLASSYRNAASLLQFFLLQSQQKDSRDKARIAAQWLEKSSQLFADSLKKGDARNRALYMNKIAKFMKTDGTDGISELIPLKDSLAASKDLPANIDLLVGYSLAIAPPTAQQGMQIMNQVSGRISVYGRLAQKLTEALVEYGLDADGNALSQSRPGAETKLTYCVQIARGMPAGGQHMVMNTAIFIWSKANSGKRAPSFLKDGFSGVLPVEALREKEALQNLSAQNYKESSNLYKVIASSFAKSDLAQALDERLWEIELLSFQKSSLLAELEKSFMSFRERYPNQGKKGFNAYLFESYRKLVDAQLDKALSAASKQPNLTQIAMRYAKIEADKNFAAGIKGKVAQLYRNMKMYKEAVDIYLELAREQPLKNYTLAAEVQSLLANWPEQPNLSKLPPGKAAERSKLLTIYETLNQLKNGDDWNIVAHMGALHRALGQPKNAEAVWLKTLRSNSNSKHALEAGGIMLSEFYAAKRWHEVVDLAHLLAARKANPTLQGKPLNYRPWLADSLFIGAAADLQAKNYNRTIKYLEEFIQVFPNESRVASSAYSLAFAYKGANRLSSALGISRMLVEKHPSYNQRSKAMLQAGDWAAADKNSWEYAFYFYGKYITDYKNEANVPQVRATLADLYLKRKLYGWASRLYKEQSLAPKVPRDQQLLAAIKTMEIEDQFGEPQEAYKAAQRVIELSGPSDPGRYRAYAFQGRFAANAKDLHAMTSIESKLLGASKNNKEAADALGLLRFKRAEILTKPIVYTENNLTIKDPEGVIKKYFDRFESERKHYVAVCQIGISTHCAPSYMRLLGIANQALDAMNKVEIADTLGASRVNSFKVLKQLYFSKVQQAKKEYTDQATRLAKQGTTTPIWKDEILKSLEYEEKLAH